MAIALSQHDYWELVCQEPVCQELVCQESVCEGAASRQTASVTDDFESIHPYPSRLGRGFVRSIFLREGIDLAIADYQSHSDLILHSVDRSHPLEYAFTIPNGDFSLKDAPPYQFFGSGIAPGEQGQEFANQRTAWVSVHIDAEVFRSFAGNAAGEVPESLQHLVGDPDQLYYIRSGQATPAMGTALRQIVSCPYQGLTRRMFLEGKVLELMSLLLEEEASLRSGKPLFADLKPDDVDRVHYARDILLQHLQKPPSLAQLARQVGLNECTLKRGFRRVFGTTAFGYLYSYRLEQARQLLQERYLNVSEVADAVGFGSCSHLSKAFRQKYGVSPKQYQTQRKP